MKNIAIYEPAKYIENPKYEKVDEHIYKTFDDFMKKDMYVTSLQFEQEPEFDEGDSPEFISQYPLEDILEEFLVHVSDFYKEENKNSESVCFQEFGAFSIEDIKKLHGIVGKHVYNEAYENEKDGKMYIRLVIE